jgi:hypothetical protein
MLKAWHNLSLNTTEISIIRAVMSDDLISFYFALSISKETNLSDAFGSSKASKL